MVIEPILYMHSQVREILFDILQLDKKCSRSLHLTQKQREKSTSEQVLESLKPIHPLPGLILQHRKLSRLLSFLQSLLPLISQSHSRIFPCWQQTGAATGRISCNSPNLQVSSDKHLSMSIDPKLKIGMLVVIISVRWF